MANILMIIPALYCGGGLQKISLQLSEGLIKRGHNIVVIDDYNPPMDKLQYLEVIPRFAKLPSYECSPNNIELFDKILKGNCIDLIIYQGFFPRVNKFLKEYVKTHDAKIISCFHNSPDAPMPKGIRYLEKNLKGIIKSILYPLYYQYSKNKVKNFLKEPYDFSKKIILLSENFIQLYKKYTCVKIDNIEIIPNFITKVHEPTSNIKKQLLYVGRLEEEQKKVSRILHIWSKILIQKQDWELILAGDGKCRKHYEDFVAKNGIERVKFLGYIPDPTTLYQGSSILLMTSDYEGFGLVLAEAMSSGCVPIAFKSFKSITDIIDDGINGILVEPFNEDQFINKLLKMMNDETYLKGLSINAYIKSQCFLVENIIPKWEALINEVIDNE